MASAEQVTSEVRVCGVGDVAPGSARRFDVAGHRLAVVRIDDDWYVVGDRCSHQDYSLSEGDVWEEEREIECPKHGSTFSLLSGEPCSLPATRPVPVYDVRVDGDDVLVTIR
ncbi:MAG: non-heme iron oxygenase ferredoxin subunit [Acidimicrobiia bacterium]|nr:non-heme iron oxygenase ferredoxin subunit [Acidimicrobiia bacterium]